MALNWTWSEKVGTMLVQGTNGKGETIDETWTLYNGNALLIMLHEFREGDEDMWEMRSFFVDKPHMNNMLGLTKGYTNTFDTDYTKLLKLTLYKDKCKYMWDIVKAFTKAFDTLELEIKNSTK